MYQIMTTCKIQEHGDTMKMYKSVYILYILIMLFSLLILALFIVGLIAEKEDVKTFYLKNNQIYTNIIDYDNAFQIMIPLGNLNTKDLFIEKDHRNIPPKIYINMQHMNIFIELIPSSIKFNMYEDIKFETYIKRQKMLYLHQKQLNSVENENVNINQVNYFAESSLDGSHFIYIRMIIADNNRICITYIGKNNEDRKIAKKLINSFVIKKDTSLLRKLSHIF